MARGYSSKGGASRIECPTRIATNRNGETPRLCSIHSTADGGLFVHHFSCRTSRSAATKLTTFTSPSGQCRSLSDQSPLQSYQPQICASKDDQKIGKRFPIQGLRNTHFGEKENVRSRIIYSIQRIPRNLQPACGLPHGYRHNGCSLFDIRIWQLRIAPRSLNRRMRSAHGAGRSSR